MRWIIRILVTLMLLGVVAVTALLLMPADRIARVAEQEFESATGRALRLSGEIKPTLWPVIGVTAGRVEIANADWAASGPMISADALVIGLKPVPLMAGEIEIDTLRIETPAIRLERDASGRGNWELETVAAATETGADPSGTATAPPEAQRFAIDRAIVTGGVLSYTDHASGTTLSLTDVEVEADLPDYDGAAQVRATARANGQPVTLEASIDGFGPLLAGDVRPLEMRFGAGDNSLDFAGRAGLTPAAAEGRMVAELPAPTALFAALGQEMAPLPQGLGRVIAASGDVTLSGDGSAHLRGGEIKLDSNVIGGDADITMGAARPRLVARLSADALDLSALGGGEEGAGASGGASGGGAQATGWSTEPIDVSALDSMDAEVSLTANSIALGALSLDRSDLVARLDASRLVLDLRRIGIYGGGIGGEFVVNGRGGLSVGGDLSMDGVQLRPMLTATADYDRLVGAADGQLKFLGAGNSVDALMRNLSGDGRFAIGKGELLGLDIGGMLRNLDMSYRGAGAKTVFDSVTASFTIAKGVASNSDLKFSGPVVDATGRGTVDLGRQTLDYRLTPVALGSDTGGGVTVPVNITGPWSNPSIKPDLDELLKQNLKEEREELEQRARDAVKKKLEEEIGPVGDGQSTEDALRNRLEDEAKKGILNLLGGGSN
ncbi:AsmA family protein [Maritimibacter sp. 55A14]|uniref:AsmA family protein n=1 Tax=Maritimibacter sp. 55A14 TaxID=2174844 RepID=UPI001304ED62|nr:AsmA family protein [Maritimibacter sp. 55A14]